MFRIRQIYDDLIPMDMEVIAQVQNILKEQFRDLADEEIIKLPEMLRNPFKYRFRAFLFVADDSRGNVQGFALLSHDPVLRFSYLDYISTARKTTGGGIGGALYERVRQEVIYLKSLGLFFECLPDDPKLSKDTAIRKQNAARLRFYERYGARPIINSAYETPIKPGEDNPPYLVFDPLGKEIKLKTNTTKKIVRAILERKYGTLVSRKYIDMVVKSIKDDTLRLREPRYIKEEIPHTYEPIPQDKKILLVINDRHNIHHVKERGYVESPVRIKSIKKELDKTNLFQNVKIRHFSEKYIKKVHNPHFVDYIEKVSENLSPGKSIYPYVFPIRNASRPPKELPVRAGYYCIDTFTPLNNNAYLAAKRAVDCALTCADRILTGHRLAYALVRPPGHHAETNAFGGFCYFNSGAITANYLSRFGKVAILDIDYHHGNGQQTIFYGRSDVLTVSIHGNPRFAYPYFSGFLDEKGEDEGLGYNINIPLGEKIDGENYREALKKALRKIIRFNPRFLVVSLGLDPAKGDPTGTWDLLAKDFLENGKMVGSLRLPTIVVQEGGYKNRSLGVNARHFFTGLWDGAYCIDKATIITNRTHISNSKCRKTKNTK